jgi:hypothetical protein
MTYEYNPSDSAHEIPNPYIIENTFLLLGAIILIFGACWVLYVARSHFAAQHDRAAIAATILALMLFGVALNFIVWAFSHMRFFFGRNFPAGLADELLPSAIGKSPRAESIQEVLRQKAIQFPEPQGPLNGVLYSMVRPLIAAPPIIQFAAVRHFHALIGMIAILVSLGFSYFLFDGSPSEGLVSWLYLPLTGLSLVTLFLKQHDVQVAPHSLGMFRGVIGLVVFGMLAPIVIPRYLPHCEIVPMWIAPLILLATSVVSSLLFIKSLLSQLDSISQTAVSCEQTTIAMNCLPSQLWAEIDRDFQNNWVRNVPNRRYINLPPDVSRGDRGSFQGHILKETQPQATSTATFQNVLDALGVPYARYLVFLCSWGGLLSFATTILAGRFASQFIDMSYIEISRSLLTVFALGTSTVVTFRVGHILWSRMYFKSRITWIETSGTFQASELEAGSQFVGRVRSRSKLIRIEDATLRVWVTDIVSVTFGKPSRRFIMAMVPADGVAKGIAEHLVNFARSQSMIVAPTSERDAVHVKNLLRFEKVVKGDLSRSDNHSRIADSSRS